MAKFSTDADLLKWEPVLFRELALPSQTLCNGEDGTVNGTTLTSPNASFQQAAVAAGGVIYMYNSSDGIDGCYEIVSVDSQTQLTVSILRSSTDDGPIAPPNATDISYRISTFGPQAEEVAYSLLQYFGIDEKTTDTININILQNRPLRQASAFGVLSTIFAASAIGKNDKAGYWEKSLRYKELFQTARTKAAVEIDNNADNITDQILTGGALRLRRG